MEYRVWSTSNIIRKPVLYWEKRKGRKKLFHSIIAIPIATISTSPIRIIRSFPPLAALVFEAPDPVPVPASLPVAVPVELVLTGCVRAPSCTWDRILPM